MAPLSLVTKSSPLTRLSRVPAVSRPADLDSTARNANAGLWPGKRWVRFAGPALILLAAAIAAFPIWSHGPVAGDDFEFHSTRNRTGCTESLTRTGRPAPTSAQVSLVLSSILRSPG